MFGCGNVAEGGDAYNMFVNGDLNVVGSRGVGNRVGGLPKRRRPPDRARAIGRNMAVTGESLRRDAVAGMRCCRGSRAPDHVKR